MPMVIEIIVSHLATLFAKFCVVNKTSQELDCFNKPILTIFNKMDLYKKQTFDEWLDEETKNEILQDLKDRWQEQTAGNALFISALERTNIDKLRETIIENVRELYRLRFPYKTEFFIKASAKNINWLKIADYVNEIPFATNNIVEVVADGKTICIAKYEDRLFAFVQNVRIQPDC